ncbi:MAG: hypothetical protein WDM78_12750 [Puia sp.]
MGYKEKALTAYQADLVTHPNRFNGLYGAGLSSEKCGDKKKCSFLLSPIVGYERGIFRQAGTYESKVIFEQPLTPNA